MVERPTFKISVLTQEKVHLETEAVHLEAPGAVGYLGVLANHAPLMTTLMPGKITVTLPDGVNEVFAVSGGLLKVSGEGVVVLADTLERPDDIDLERAKEAVERARRRLKEGSTDMDMHRAAEALERAQNRLRVRTEELGG
jgi:F-type H+-transporting ATPase subunit epsilon